MQSSERARLAPKEATASQEIWQRHSVAKPPPADVTKCDFVAEPGVNQRTRLSLMENSMGNFISTSF